MQKTFESLHKTFESLHKTFESLHKMLVFPKTIWLVFFRGMVFCLHERQLTGSEKVLLLYERCLLVCEGGIKLYGGFFIFYESQKRLRDCCSCAPK